MILLSHDPDHSLRTSVHRDIRRWGLTQKQLATAKRQCLCALTLLIFAGALAGAIALKTALYIARFSFGAG